MQWFDETNDGRLARSSVGVLRRLSDSVLLALAALFSSSSSGKGRFWP